MTVVVGSILAAAAVEQVGVRLLRRMSRSTENGFDDILIDELRLPLVVTVALAGVFLLTTDDGVLAALSVEAESRNALFNRPALTLLLVVWAWSLNTIVNRGVRAVKDGGPRFDFAPVFSNVWTIVLATGTVALALSIWQIDVTPLVAGAGVAGIAVGFAAKDTVANFFGGIALYFDDTYKIGDYVVLDSGEKGTVVTVGVRSTTLQTRDEVLVTVPNAVLNSAKIVNESAPKSRRRIRVPMSVAYGTDIDAFEAAVLDVTAAERLVLDGPQPRMRFRSFGDSGLNYELLCWVHSPIRAARATHELNRAIYRRLDELDIEIPFRKMDVTLAGATETVRDHSEASPGDD
ncbi:MAG: mechanosensitive ion channel family protein [Haloarcula sp.]